MAQETGTLIRQPEWKAMINHSHTQRIDDDPRMGI